MKYLYFSSTQPQSNTNHSNIRRRIVILLPFLLIVAGCATTSKPVAQFSQTHGSILKEKKADQDSSLEKLSLEELLFRGNRHLEQGNSELATLHFQMALKRKEDSAPAYAGLGESLAASGSNTSAHLFLDKALLIDNQNRQALLATGKLYRKEKNYKQSEISFSRALDIYPDDPEILTELAVTYGQMDLEDKAEPLLIKVVDLKPRDDAALNNLGFNYLLQGNYPVAIETFRKALEINPKAPRTMNNLAAAYALNSEPQNALNLFSKTGGKASAYNDLGFLYMVRGEKETARESFEKALELSPRHYVRAKENLNLLETSPELSSEIKP